MNKLKILFLINIFVITLIIIPITQVKAQIQTKTIIDDSGTLFWTLTQSGTGSYQWYDSNNSTFKIHGIDSYQLVRSNGSYANSYIHKTFSPISDWSGYNYFCFSIFGVGISEALTIEIDTISGVANRYSLSLSYSHIGWRNYTFAFDSMILTGSPDLHQINQLQIYDFDTASFSKIDYFYLMKFNELDQSITNTIFSFLFLLILLIVNLLFMLKPIPLVSFPIGLVTIFISATLFLSDSYIPYNPYSSFFLVFIGLCNLLVQAYSYKGDKK